MSEIGVKLTGDNSSYISAMEQAAEKSEEIFGRIEHHMVGTRALATAVGSALGLHLQEIAQHLASFVTGISEENKKAYEEAEKLSEEAANGAIANMRAQATAEVRYQLALKERAHLIEIINETEIKTGLDMKRVEEAKIELNKAEAEIIKHNAEVKKADLEAQKKLNEEIIAQNKRNDEVALSRLGTEQRIAHLTQEIFDGETLIVGLKQRGLDTSVLEAQVKERKNKLTSEEVKLHADVVKRLAEGQRLDAEIAKLKFDQLPPEQQLLELQKQRAELVKWIESGELDTNQTKRAQIELLKEDEEIRRRITKSEEDAADAAERQLRAVQARILAENNASLLVDSQILSAAPTASELSGASDAAIAEYIRRATAGKSAALRTDTADSLNAGTVASGFYGATVQASLFQTGINAAQAELARRQSLRTGDYGSALSHFAGNPLFFDRAYQQANSPGELGTKLDKLNNGLTALNQHFGVNAPFAS